MPADPGEAAFIRRRDFLRCASVGAIVASVATPAMLQAAARANPLKPGAGGRRPNVILLLTDQQPAGLTKRSGFPFDTMPTMDRLAGDGVDFARAYCTMPACTPSRTSMLTGRWPSAHRVRMNYQADAAFFEKDVYQVAREAGYRTGLAGKNHTYLKKDQVDFWRNYSHEVGDETGGDKAQNAAYEKWLKELSFNVSTKPTPFPVDVQFPYRIVSDAMDFIDQSGTQPFFLQVSIPEPHNPEQVPEPYWDMFPPAALPERGAGLEALEKLGDRARWLHRLENYGYRDTEKNWRRYVSNYLGMLRLIDDQVKRLVGHLEAKGVLQDTIIVRVADHGDYLMKYGLGRKGVGLPETLVHIPMVWHGPGIHDRGKVGETCFVSMADVMPTLCEAMGAPIPHGVQGRSLLPLMCGEAYPEAEFRSIYAEAGLGGLYYEQSDNVPPSIAGKQDDGFDELNMVTQSGNQKMVRMGKWKLIYDMMGYGQLYDLDRDPDELTNLFNRPEVAAEQGTLLAELLMWTVRNQDSLPTGPQFRKYQTKWPTQHNWYAPHRHAEPGMPFVP
ncbi:sulfatase [Novosphingobium kaempferiae]|uniref:sulfatase family protein n=1 Tax=Novosphingobium kaempferiae TaxID=2896849 RepID=UPI001E4E32A6|nr:sulfatase-like hydrolase/transferase [Novosphingobium kaempferiae]